LQHLGGRGLSLERFALRGYKARVLDGNYGLVSETLDQIDLLVCKWLHLGTTDSEYANGIALPQQRDGQICSEAKAKCRLTAIRELVSSYLKVVNVGRRTIDEGASGNNLPTTDLRFDLR
jgi:hypothetical protein